MVLAISSALFLGAGCAHRKPRPVDKEREEYLVTVGDDADFEEPRFYDKSGLGIFATCAGNTLVISARNKGTEQMMIMQTDLALITGPDPRRDLVRVTPATADLSRFTPLILGPNERGTRRIPMRELGSLSGMRLVYNNPRQEIRFFVDIP